jgi:AcrR family transcriptional regulator
LALRDTHKPGYGAASMGRTPWGDASELRARMLRPGRGTPREEAERNQRERLFAAMAATVAEKGYEATTVADLVELSGVSRSAFYRHFADKQECFLAAVEELVQPTIELMEQAERSSVGEERTREALESFLKLVAAQPAAGKMCFVEIYAAGPEGVEALQRALEKFEKFAGTLFAQVPGREAMPRQMVRAMIGGLQKVVHKRLYRDEQEDLVELAPQIWKWWLSYAQPPAPLRAPRRRLKQPRPFEERQAVANPAERVLRALAAIVSEKGYPATTVAEVVDRASTSQRTFYEHFANKEDALIAALDSGSAQMLATTLPAFRRAPDWQHAVRGAYEAMFAFGVEEPEYSRLGAVEMYAAGKRALETRDTVMEGLEALLAPGYELAPDTPPIAAEAIGGAIYALTYDQVKEKGPESLPELVPMATYMTLAPFLGAEEAYALAEGGAPAGADGKR